VPRSRERYSGCLSPPGDLQPRRDAQALLLGGWGQVFASDLEVSRGFLSISSAPKASFPSLFIQLVSWDYSLPWELLLVVAGYQF